MGNISKKTRKKLVKVLNANCHRVTHFGEPSVTFVPYDSSPLSAIWKYLCIRNDGVITGRFLVDRSEKRIPYGGQQALRRRRTEIRRTQCG